MLGLFSCFIELYETENKASNENTRDPALAI